MSLSHSRESKPWSAQALNALFDEETQLRAVRLREHGGRIEYATIGAEMDPELKRKLEQAQVEIRSALKAAKQDRARLIGQLAITETGGDCLLARPSCPTAPQLWRWRPIEEDEDQEEDEDDWRVLLSWALGCGVLGLTAWLASWFGFVANSVTIGLYAAGIVLGSIDAAMDSFDKLRKGKVDIHFLMVSVAVGASAIGAWGEAALLMFLFSFSGALEAYAMNRTRREIESLFELAPDEATQIADDGAERIVPVEALVARDRIRVRSGELVPVDCVVVSGESATDESNLTGESIPIPKTKSDPIQAGSLNLWGSLECRVERPASESALQKIIRLIKQAKQRRAPAQRLVDRFGTPYAIGILSASLALFLVWWLALGVPAFSNTESVRSAFYRSMTFLVVASPCALALSIPSAILAAIAWGARRGILFRGGAALERLTEVDTLALDKTGTLTKGQFEVQRIESIPTGQKDRLLQIAYSLEIHSTHPLARAIRSYAEARGVKAVAVNRFEALEGQGLHGSLDGASCFVGRRSIIESTSASDVAKNFPELLPGESEIWLAYSDLIGRIVVKDSLREESAATLEKARSLGLRPIMLTGDRQESALAIASSLGLRPDEVRYAQSPADKVNAIRQLKDNASTVAMIGDGVNDGPSLAAADVAIAMGAHGSDTALEQSDIVLVDDRIEKFIAAFLLSRRTKTVIRQNLALALGTVALMSISSAFGLVPLGLGVFAHEGSTVLVCLNSLRLLFASDPISTKES